MYHIYRFSRQGPEKKPTWIMREYKDGKLINTQHLINSDACMMILALCDKGFEEVPGDPYLYVLAG